MKSIWASKTIWLNALALGLGWFLNHQGILEAAGVSADLQVTILTLANMALRLVSVGRVTLTGR